MSWLVGLTQGFQNAQNRYRDEELKRAQNAHELEQKIYTTLMQSEDPEMQDLAFNELLRSAGGPKRKGGLSGWIGQYQQSGGMDRVRALFNTPKTTPGLPSRQLQNPIGALMTGTPPSGAMAAQSAVEPGGQAPPPQAAMPPQPPTDTSQWDLRPDGSKKGSGFLGVFKVPGSEDVASEYSIADSEQLKDAQGNYLDYPTLVPTLTRDELFQVLEAARTHQPVSPAVAQKAEAFALQRRAAGKPLFAEEGEQQALYPDIPRWVPGMSIDVKPDGGASTAEPKTPAPTTSRFVDTGYRDLTPGAPAAPAATTPSSGGAYGELTQGPAVGRSERRKLFPTPEDLLEREAQGEQLKTAAKTRAEYGELERIYGPERAKEIYDERLTGSARSQRWGTESLWEEQVSDGRGGIKTVYYRAARRPDGQYVDLQTNKPLPPGARPNRNASAFIRTIDKDGNLWLSDPNTGETWLQGRGVGKPQTPSGVVHRYTAKGPDGQNHFYEQHADGSITEVPGIAPMNEPAPDAEVTNARELLKQIEEQIRTEFPPTLAMMPDQRNAEITKRRDELAAAGGIFANFADLTTKAYGQKRPTTNRDDPALPLGVKQYINKLRYTDYPNDKEKARAALANAMDPLYKDHPNLSWARVSAYFDQVYGQLKDAPGTLIGAGAPPAGPTPPKAAAPAAPATRAPAGGATSGATMSRAEFQQRLATLNAAKAKQKQPAVSPADYEKTLRAAGITVEP